ncbi:alpha/beta fold hydrolase [Siminovitchia sp. 179-K 8D1 HS]|uniref:alpha/beta fold hydrolase n=1 Tax=Siminovitchia sp. 179-K 8D1 HS TaxID=3142385 RepID=UPI0039A15A66
MGTYITTKKGRIFYIHDTPGNKGTIIGVHGLTGNHKQLHYVQEALSGAYRFISYDIRGRGNSGPANTNSSIAAHAEDLLDLIDTLRVERPILLGYSMGGYISALVASRLPGVEALVLLDGAGLADHGTRELVLPSLERLEKAYSTPEQYVEEARNLYSNLQIDWNEHLEEIARYEIKVEEGIWRHKSDRACIEQDFESFYDFQPDQIFPLISCPVFLLIATGKIGGKCPLFKEEAYHKAKELMKNIQTEYAPVNHYELVFNQQPEVFERIQRFLSSKEVTS